MRQDENQEKTVLKRPSKESTFRRTEQTSASGRSTKTPTEKAKPPALRDTDALERLARVALVVWWDERLHRRRKQGTEGQKTIPGRLIINGRREKMAVGKGGEEGCFARIKVPGQSFMMLRKMQEGADKCGCDTLEWSTGGWMERADGWATLTGGGDTGSSIVMGDDTVFEIRCNRVFTALPPYV